MVSMVTSCAWCANLRLVADCICSSALAEDGVDASLVRRVLANYVCVRVGVRVCVGGGGGVCEGETQ